MELGFGEYAEKSLYFVNWGYTDIVQNKVSNGAFKWFKIFNQFNEKAFIRKRLAIEIGVRSVLILGVPDGFIEFASNQDLIENNEIANQIYYQLQPEYQPKIDIQTPVNEKRKRNQENDPIRYSQNLPITPKKIEKINNRNQDLNFDYDDYINVQESSRESIILLNNHNDNEKIYQPLKSFYKWNIGVRQQGFQLHELPEDYVNQIFENQYFEELELKNEMNRVWQQEFKQNDINFQDIKKDYIK